MSPLEKNSSDFTSATRTLESMPAAGTAFAQTMLGCCGQCQSEVAQLTSRRARAWMELPETLSACRTIPEVVRVQSDFVRQFWSDWLGTSQRIAAVWASVLEPPAGLASASAEGDARARKTNDEADPFAVWEWWRTDMKGIMPRRSEAQSAAAGRHGAH
jgi:hypothetical protein